MRIFFIHDPVKERNNEVFIYVHIPKTGGQTLGKILDEQFQITEILKYKQPQTMEGLLSGASKEKASKVGCYVEHLENYLQQTPGGDVNINCIYGHMHFGMHRYLTKPYTYFTVLRDPIDRVVSHYYYFLGKGHFKKETTFEEFITTPKFFNFQTRYLAGGVPDLEAAKANMDSNFPIVGITEMFDETLFLMKKHFCWHNIVYTKKNVTAKRPSKEQISQEMMDLIVQHNEMDIQLYQYARNALEEKIKALDPKSMEELQAYKQQQQQNSI
ncbi:sulfotransferase family 2 domain-containing protein [Bacillus salipaludis]|uniref:Sulfotransferase family 2 domain-containing protein n=1 Tax=Bacillus salipaludis TaxID=2547811 RepID=A0ABW8RML2_9BACI